MYLARPNSSYPDWGYSDGRGSDPYGLSAAADRKILQLYPLRDRAVEARLRVNEPVRLNPAAASAVAAFDASYQACFDNMVEANVVACEQAATAAQRAAGVIP